jgi:hypothetical protein
MSNDKTDAELAIISAIAAEAVEALHDNASLAVEIIEDRIQFLVDAELIEVDEDSDLVRDILHVALDALLDVMADEDCEYCDESDEDEDCDERAY